MRLAVGLARRAVGLASRYRLRELQMLAAPCCLVLAAPWLSQVGGAGQAPVAGMTVVVALGYCLLMLACTAVLTIAAPWADQHLWPVAALLLALRLVLGVWEPPVPVAASALPGDRGELALVTQALSLPGTAAVIALYAVLATRGARVAMLQVGWRAPVTVAVTAAMSLQAAYALASHLGLLPRGVLPTGPTVPAPFLEGGWPALLIDGALLVALLHLSSAARGARPDLPPVGVAGTVGVSARVRRLQRFGYGLLGMFFVLLLVAGWRAAGGMGG